jgi:hypothetical protein
MTENSEGHSLTFEIEVGNFIEGFSVSGMFYSAASVICGGNFRHFLPQCTHALKSLLRIDGNKYIVYTVYRTVRTCTCILCICITYCRIQRSIMLILVNSAVPL